jgi:hypothetical protein
MPHFSYIVIVVSPVVLGFEDDEEVAAILGMKMLASLGLPAERVWV